MQQPSFAASQRKGTATGLPCAVNIFRGNELFVLKAISEAVCIETEAMWSGNCLWNSVWKSGYTRTCGWLEGESPSPSCPSCHVPLTIQLAVSVPSGYEIYDIGEVLVYWLNTDLMVSSCSVIICSVCVPYDIILINEVVSQKQKSRSEEEGTETTHGAVTEADVSLCFSHSSSAVEASACNTGERKKFFFWNILLYACWKPCGTQLNSF
jgi:hypothetical protein